MEGGGDDLYNDMEGVRERLSSETAMIGQEKARAHESEQRAKQSKKEVAAYKLKTEQLRQRCTMLEKNLSCLFKTAWAHLHRKDVQIVDLKQQIKEFRKVTGMIKPGVKHEDAQKEVQKDDVRMEGGEKETPSKASADTNAETGSPQKQAEPAQRATQGTRSEHKHNGTSIRVHNSSVDRGQAAYKGAAAQLPLGSCAAEHTVPQHQQRHRQQHKPDREGNRVQHGDRDGSGRDEPRSRRSSSPSRCDQRRRDASPPPHPPRERTARPREQTQREDRDLRDWDVRKRERGVRDRDSRDMRDRDARPDRGNLRRTQQGPGEDRHRYGHDSQRRKGGRSRSRSPRG